MGTLSHPEAANGGPSLKAVATDRIRESIAAGIFPLGHRLSDKALARELSISRTPVREALLQLQSEGLVVVRPKSGTFVFDLSPDEVREICDLRGLFERGAAFMAAERDRDRLIAVLATSVAEASLALEAGDFARCEAFDTMFHEGLIAASGNRYLIASYRSISDKVRALRRRLPQFRSRFAKALEQHRRIVDLIALDRIDAAGEELGAHVRNVHALLAPSFTRRE